MQMTLLSITVCLTHFLIASSLDFNTPPTNTQRIYTEAKIITETTTETNQKLEVLIDTTALSPLVMTTQDNTITTALASDAQTHTGIIPNVTSIEETSPVHQFNMSTESQNDIMDVAKTTDGERNTIMLHTNTSLTAIPVFSARPTQQMDDKNETGRTSSAHSTSYDNDGHSSMGYNTETQTAGIWDISPVTQATSEPLNSVQTVSWRKRTVEPNETMNANVGNYEMSSTQTTFANMNEKSERTQETTGSYSLTTEHMLLMHTEEHYNTTPNATDTSETPTMENNWITSQITHIPPTTTAYPTSDDLNITDTTENHSATPVFVIKSDDSATQQSVNKITNSTAHTERENQTLSVTLNTPSGTTNNNNSSIIANVVTDSEINATSIITDLTSLWPECFNSNSKQTSRLVCFITLWSLAMTASVFLGITIFLWVRLSVLKKRAKLRGKRQDKGGQKWEKESLWADPQASVQDRVEFWYVNGSTLEADRKDRERRREKKNKRKKQEPNETENEFWIQPRVTVDDITEFWYANRRIKEGRTGIV